MAAIGKLKQHAVPLPQAPCSADKHATDLSILMDTLSGHTDVIGANIDASQPPPTHAAFSPASSTSSSLYPHRRTTVLIHQKSPLLVATPPQVTRALAYSHSFLLPLSHFVGLLSWTTKDPWESFLLLASFWLVTLYGDFLLRFFGPLLMAIALTLAMYTRRYSPLSSQPGSKKHSRSSASAMTAPQRDVRHQKSLDDILDTLKLFTSRCTILLDPWLRLTDFLSRTRTPTSASTRESLMTLFFRLLCVTPLWYALTLPPLYVLTTRRVILTFGTLILTWHSRPARVSRAILWRSGSVRRLASFLTGFDLSHENRRRATGLPPRSSRTANDIAMALASARTGVKTPGGTNSEGDAGKEGIRFTFAIYENQRRWIGIGWTSSMLAYERAAWTDEGLHPAEPKNDFKLPEVEGGVAEWRWVKGSQWRVELSGEEANVKTTGKSSKRPHPSFKTALEYSGSGSEDDRRGAVTGEDDEQGWIYYDNKWRDGRRGQDGWGRYTRRRKWVRDAELVELSRPSTPAVSAGNYFPDSTSVASSSTPSTPVLGASGNFSASGGHVRSASKDSEWTAAGRDKAARSGWFRRMRAGSASTVNTVSSSGTTVQGMTAATAGREDEKAAAAAAATMMMEKDGGGDDGYVPLRFRGRQVGEDAEWGVGEDAGLQLG